VLEKLQVHSRAEAATLAVEYNLIERFAGKR
jgi:DNA-binding NarL/FixJ family response regulator